MTAIQLPSEMEEEIIYHLLKSFWDEKEETASNLKAFRSQLSEFLKLGYDFCTILVFPALRRFQKLCKKAADLQLDESGRLVSADEESDPVITPTPKDLVGYINDREYLKIPMTYRRALYYFTVAEVYKHRIRCLRSSFDAGRLTWDVLAVQCASYEMELVDAETNVELAQFPALKHTGFLHEASPDEYARRWEEFVEGNMARYFFRLFWGTSVSRRLIDGPLGPERALRLFGDIHMESEY